MTMTEIHLTRNVVLKGVSVVYLMAFMSLYIQIPGLYGAQGVLPAHVKLESGPESTLWDQLAARPSLLWLRGLLGLNTQHAMELLSVLGVLLAVLSVLFEGFRTSLVYGALLVLYGSLVQVGQVFLWHQWDTLLLEAGVLAALLAPMFPWERQQPWDALGLFLLRWLLFRVTFSSGIAKLASRDPGWWGLTAFETVWETEAVPSALGWYLHQLPVWVLRGWTVLLLVAQIAVPFLFFAPVRRLRLFAFWTQVVFHLAALLTGNTAFFHPLLLVLCLSLLDDDWLLGRRQTSGGLSGVLNTLATFAGYGALLLATVALFELRLDTSGLAARTVFSKADFAAFSAQAVPAAMALAAAAFLLAAAEALTAALMDTAGCCAALDAIWRTLVAVLISAAVFSSSLVPLAGLEPALEKALPAVLRESAAPLLDYRLLGAYGGFHRQTVTGGRPEIVLEGAMSQKGPWTEIPLRYKPGDLSRQPPVLLTYQARLDLQMAQAAPGNYHGNPWVTSLAYRLLTGQPEVLRLLDTKEYHFAAKPPKYVRGLKYRYKFSPWSRASGGAWWQRETTSEEYLPTYTADHKPLLEYLTKLNMIGRPEEASAGGATSATLRQLRQLLNPWDPASLVWGLLIACWAVGLSRGVPWFR